VLKSLLAIAGVMSEHASRMSMMLARVVIRHETRQLVDPIVVIAVECKHLPDIIFEYVIELSTTGAFNFEYVE